MEDLIKQVLEKYFTEYKNYHLLILIAYTLVIALLQVIQTFIVTKKVENFKNELKKS